MPHLQCIPARASLMITTNSNEMYEAPPSSLTPPPRSVYRAYVTSVAETTDCDQSPLIMSSPQLSKMTSPKPILHQRPLVSRSKPIEDLPEPAANGGNVASPTVSFGTPSVLSPGSNLTSPPPTAMAPVRPPIRGPRTVPLPQGVSSNSITTTTSAPNLTTPKSAQSSSSGKPAVTSQKSKDLAVSSPTKSFRQKAFEKSQNLTSTHDRSGHVRQKESAGQRMKEGAFFAFVILPMSCWYTRGGRTLNASKRLGNGHLRMDDDDDDDDGTHSVDSRAPRRIEPMTTITPPRSPTRARRMSDDGYRQPNTPKRNAAGEMNRRVSFDGKVTVMRGRSRINLKDDYQRSASVGRERAMILYREDSFDELRERSSTPNHRRSFDGKRPAARDIEPRKTHARGNSFESKALVHVPREPLPFRRGSFEHERSGSMTRQRYNDNFEHQRTGSMTQRQHSPYKYSRKAQHDRAGSFSRRNRSQDWAPSQMQMARYAPPTQRAAPMSRREWEWEREQDRRREPASNNKNNRIMSMGMPPPVMGAERWM